MNRAIKTLCLILTLSICQRIKSQENTTINNNELEEIYIRHSIQHPSDILFQDIRPFSYRQVYSMLWDRELSDFNLFDKNVFPYVNYEFSDKGIAKEAIIRMNKKTHGFFYPNQGSFAQVDDSILSLRLNPIFEGSVGIESASEGLRYRNTRGIELSGNIQKKVYFYTQITENQVRLFDYVKHYGSGLNNSNSYNFNPSFTYWKDINNNMGYDFLNSMGRVEYTPNNNFSISIGHDRNHYGYGYRSLILGDNGAPYFSLKTDVNVWKFHYQALFAQLTGQYLRGSDRLLPKKYGAFHLLSYKPSKKVELGIFEGVIFNRTNGFDLNYLNPLIFYRAIEHSLGSPDNVTMGLQASYQPNRHLQVYTQFLLDDIQVGEFIKGSGWWGNKYAGQLGMRWINMFNVNVLSLQLECNVVRPYTYSHNTSDSGVDANIDNFTHYNQPLAHPFGANFIELHTRLSYQPFSRLKLDLVANSSVRGQNIRSQNYGGDIFINTDGNGLPQRYQNTIGQGNRNQVLYIMLRSQYQIYHNVFIDLDFIHRQNNDELLSSMNSSFGFMSGLRVNLRKRDNIF